MLYEGERRKEALVDFAMKAAGPVVDMVNTVQQLSEVSVTYVHLLSMTSSTPCFTLNGGDVTKTKRFASKTS